MKLSILVAGEYLGQSKMDEIFLNIPDHEFIIGICIEGKNQFLHRGNIKVVTQSESNIGIRKNSLLNFAKGDWILLLDTDEVPSPELLKEIGGIIMDRSRKIYGYSIPYQNYVFGKPVFYGGEKYSKVRLFRKKYGSITTVPIHEEVIIKGKSRELKSALHHYSYRTPWQVITKFTRYAWLIAGEKSKGHERVSFAKLFLYGPHMFWARCVGDEGWRDGWRGVVLALLFGCMESMIYWLLLWRNLAYL